MDIGSRQEVRSFLDGGGELGALMRAYDWAATPLGPPDSWPRSLKTAVRIMLTSRQPIWLGWGPELTYLYNDPYKSIIGGKHPRALGRPFSEVWHEIWDIVGPMAESVMTRDEGTYVEQELLIMERHGYQEETYYTFSYSPVPNDEGGPGGLICANTDETRRVIGERQLASLSELAASAASARSWRDACELAVRALARNPHDIPFALIFTAGLEGNSLSAHSPGTEALCDPALWNCQEVIESGETRLVRLGATFGALPQGAWPRAPRQAAVLPFLEPGRSGRAGALVVGLNPFRQFDESYRDFLRLAVRQVASAIANAEAYEEERRRAEALAELDRAKTVFFSNVSHELRTPLTLMLGPIADILAKPEEGVLPENRELLTTVHRNALRLLKLVNTLLDFSRIEAGRAQAALEAVDLGVLTADLASNFRAACERAGIRLDVECPPLAEAAYVDREMWEKIVLNLMSNAFKFTLEGGIRVSVRAAGERFELEVADTGSGIPPAELPHLFERFHRVQGAQGRSHEGTGIGLALVHELVKLHGGNIAVDSHEGEGTTFTVSVPRGNAHAPAASRPSPGAGAGGDRAGAFVNEALSWLPGAAPEPPTPRPQGAFRVLLADDNADLREYVRRLLAQRYRVEAVEDGQAALAAARRSAPDLVISDVMMPRLDGFGLIRELRADPGLYAVPVLLLSARAGEEARIEGLGQGADDYLAKPFSSRELLVRVDSMVRSSAMYRRVNEALAQFQSLLNQAPLGVYVVDESLRFVAINPVARQVFGDLPDLIGRGLERVVRTLWPQDHADQVMRQFRQTLATGEPYFVAEHIGERVDRRQTEYYEWQIHRIPLPGERHGVVCYFRDISKSVMAREALRDADRRKDEFLATLSHELRNPLAPLRNSLHLLRLTGEGAAPSVQVREIMERQVNHLVRLVDDLLEMSRVSRGTFELRRQRVEMAVVVRNAVETSNPLIEGWGHKLSVALPGATLWLDGDPVRLAQILSNLLNNAAVYTERGGNISVTARQQDGAAVITVRDNGRGIPAAELENIFEMFNRGNSAGSHGPGGLGIGLALARKLAEMHGGSLVAASAGAGQGSEFILRLPLAPAPAQPDQAELVSREAAQVAAQQRVLVVDDNRDAADSLGSILKMLGAEVRVANDGEQALAAYREFNPAVVLLDIGMPGMSGYEVAKRLREDFPGRRTALVALTGWGQEQDRHRARDAGFDLHLVKPAEIGDIQTLLSSLAEAPQP